MENNQLVNNGCELCNNPAKWQVVFGHEYKFGFPYLFARSQIYEIGCVKANYCPICGRNLKEENNNG